MRETAALANEPDALSIKWRPPVSVGLGGYGPPQPIQKLFPKEDGFLRSGEKWRTITRLSRDSCEVGCLFAVPGQRGAGLATLPDQRHHSVYREAAGHEPA
jgi:hypothetical protein